MHIIICRSNPVAPDPRVEKEAQALINAGYQVEVIGWDRSGSYPVNEKKEGYTVHRIQIPAKYGAGIGNIINLIVWQFRLSLWLYSHRRVCDVLHACDFDTILPCFLMKLVFEKKIVYDIFDFYPDHLRNTPEWIKNSIRTLDQWLINHADSVILVDDSRREQIKDTKPKSVSIIYNSPQDIKLQDHNYIPSSNGRLQLIYVGLLQKERGIIEAASLLKNHRNWVLDIAGFGGDEDEIYAACKDLHNINWHGTVSYKKALKLSAAADVLFATYDPSIPNHRYSSPNKLFEAMMLGKPIIVSQNTNMDMIVERHNCGIIVSYGNITELDAALQKLANDPSLRARLGTNARKAYETEYSWQIMSSRLVKLYSQFQTADA
ncbi:MAG TPA: glycosyltransferase WbuB [Anaerolineae bacterium]|nr:glycosyltransferase WbuB [Anaerolineae bacterium]